MDPHAWAKVRARESLDSLELLVSRTRAVDAGVSIAMLEEIARLRERLEWCNSCFSRHRSHHLLRWVIRAAAELLIWWMGTSRCAFRAILHKSPSKYDTRHDNKAASNCSPDAPGASRIQGGNFEFLPFAA
jgi:hypothetical protein